jgi:hypothetical protein
MTLLCNFSNGNRAIRFLTAAAKTAYAGSGSLPVTVNTPTVAKMLLNYLTPHPSDLNEYLNEDINQGLSSSKKTAYTSCGINHSCRETPKAFTTTCF